MNSRSLLLSLTILLLLSPLPAHAYADPSGGTLFQILMPTLAALWAMWMILANKIQRFVGGLFRRRSQETADSNRAEE